MLLDLHVHSCHSADSASKPLDLVKRAAEKGIGFAITDHNSCDGWKDFQKLGKQFNVQVVLGSEIRVYQGNRELGEILALFLKKPVLENEFKDAVEQVHDQGGIVAVAHPFDLLRSPYLRGFKDLEKLKRQLDAVEVFNSRTVVKKFNSRAKKFAKENSLPMICGSDAHTVEELGNSLTEVRASSLEQAKAEILAARTRLRCHGAGLLVHGHSTMAKFGLRK